MAVDGYEPVTKFEDWYSNFSVNERNDTLSSFTVSPCATRHQRAFEEFKREHLSRTANYWKYETMVDAEVVSAKPDLPNVSSGDIAGMARRTARNVVQHTPNVEVICEFDDDSAAGILARHTLLTKIVHEELNSNEMQQNLFASTMAAFTVGFDAVVAVLTQRADNTWVIEYDQLNYQDVFPETGVKSITKCPEVYVRRYLTKGELAALIRDTPVGWDRLALRTLAQSSPPARQMESVSRQEKKHHVVPSGYEIVTWYSRSGDPFLTFSPTSGLLLRIEKNKDPLKRLPVHFLQLERDNQQPLGKSQVALAYGRQEFQDLMLNGAMKMWYRNINPPLIGYGTGLNGAPNLSPGKYMNVPNPNSRIEAFEVNTQTLLQYGSISQQNMGSMINLTGAADQQMAASAGNGMSATPQGVEAQDQLVDITTNNYQKAIEHFFSQYCSYALTVYFAEMKNAEKVIPTADARRQLLAAGANEEMFDADGVFSVKMSEMATIYNVRCIPGSLVEMEDEKQMRILNQLFVPLSQAMPALAAAQDPQMLANAAMAMQFIINKEIQLSGAADSSELSQVFQKGTTAEVENHAIKVAGLEEQVGMLTASYTENQQTLTSQMSQLQEQISLLTQANGMLLEKMGVTNQASTPENAQPLTTQP